MAKEKKAMVDHPGWKNLEKGHRFKKGDDPRRNLEGRPRKFVTTLALEGYTLAEANDCIQQLLGADEKTLESIDSNKDAAVLERIVAKVLLKDMRGGHMDSLSSLMDRVFGKPKMDVEVTGKVEHFHHVPLNLDRNLMMQIVMGRVAARNGMDVGRMTALLSESYYSKTIDAEATVIEDKPLPSDLNYSIEEKMRDANEKKAMEDESIEDMLKRQLMERMEAIRGEKKPVEPRKPSVKDLLLGRGEKG